MSANIKMTDEERLALAAKLDKELDTFIDGLEKKRYTDGWPEDRWQEEMEKHPFFMKKAPEPGDELHPLLHGIQQLKYDPEENTALELAGKYKEDGNFYTKHKKFRMAVLCYTEGIKINCKENEIKAVLFNNRSAAQFFLKNYRSSLSDAQKSIELKPDYAKPKWRAAQCAFHLNKFDLCFKYCDEILDVDPKNTQASELMKKSEAKKIETERNERKLKAMEKRKVAEFKRTLEEIQKRGIKLDKSKTFSEITTDFLKPNLLPLEDHPVKADENGVLTWPVAFCYPQFLISDFQKELREDIIMKDCINDMFSSQMDCDPQYKYRPENLAVYYENRFTATVHKIDLNKTLLQILQEKNFYINQGCVIFYVVPNGSEVEQKFLKEPRPKKPYF